jgi:hypothetical protein
MTITVASFQDDINNTLVTHIYANDAGVKYLSASGLGKLARHVRNLSFQADAPVEVAFTLSNTKEATNEDPEVQKSVLWDVQTVPAKTITMFNKTFTAMRLTFTGPGELHIGLE